MAESNKQLTPIKVSETDQVSGSDLDNFWVLGFDKNNNKSAHATMSQLKGNMGDSAFQLWQKQPGNTGKTYEEYLAYNRQPATEAAAQANEQMSNIKKEADSVIKDAADAAKTANDAAENVQDGKTPVLASVNAQSGVYASGSFADDGVDESGNPKYILNLTVPAGKDGQPAIFEQGTTTTLEPAEDARVDVVENGETEQGNPKYILNFFIPRGQIGKPGEGSGNVSADGTGLVIGKKYLFVPDSDGSTSGTFVEYVAPEIPEQVQPDWNATEGKGAILHKPGDATADASGLMSADQFQKLEKLNPSYLSNDVTGKKVEYTDAGKLLFEDKETFAVDANNELTLAGKKLSELGGAVQYLDLSPLFDAEGSPVTTTTDEFLAQVETAYVNHIGLAIVAGSVASMNLLSEETTYNIMVNLSFISNDFSMRLNNNAQLVVYGFIITKADKSVSSALSLNELTNTGDGTKFKSDDGTYKEINLAQFIKKDGSTPFTNEQDMVRDGNLTLRFRDADKTIRGYVGSIVVGGDITEDKSGIWLRNHKADKTVMLRDNGKLTYNDYEILHSGNLNESSSLATTAKNGLMSSTDKTKLDRIGSYTTATTVANLNANYENIEISNLSANASLSVNLTGATYNGWEIFVAIYCSSARTITIPTTGSYISMIGSSLSCPAGKWTELHLKCTGGKWRIAKLEQQ